MKLRVGLLSSAALVMMVSCKSRPSRPDFPNGRSQNPDIEEIVSATDSKDGSPSGSGAPFQTPPAAVVQPLESVVTIMQPSIEGTSEQTAITVTLYGIGLYKSVSEVIGVDKLSEDKLPAERDGTYAVGCSVFNTKEWKSSGIEFEGGRLHGIDLYFDNEKCEGKPTTSGRDSKSLAFIDYEKVLVAQKFVVTSDDKSLTITLPSGESTVLNKLSFAERKIGAPVLAGELPMGTTVIKYGAGVTNFVKVTLGTLSEPDPLLNTANEEIYVQMCKAYGTRESFNEVLKIKNGLLYGATVSYKNRECSGDGYERLEDHDGVNFADYASALKKYGSSVSKIKDYILISDRSPDGYARQTLMRKREIQRKLGAFPVLDGLGTTKYLIDAVRPKVTSNDPGLKIANGYYIRSCQGFTKKTWKASGLYVVKGLVYGVELYYDNDTCSGKALSGASDQYNDFFTTYMRAAKLQSATVNLSSPDIISLDYNTGATVEYAKTNVTLP